MDLKRRLAALDRTTRRQDGQAPATEPVHADEAERRRRLEDLGLARSDTAGGPLWSRTMRDAVAPPGSVPDLTGFFVRDGGARPDPAAILLLDTETTGLAGGTGTLAFLVGMSWWEGAELVTRQLFLAGPADEPALLAELAATASRFEVVATFNGASFDLPLLRTRALLNRRADPLAGLTSWDLLVPVRRLWGRALPDCRQRTVETEICGRGRPEADLDSARIPQAWFDYLAGQDSPELEGVLVHNHGDMVGMASIWLKILAAAEAQPRTARAGWRDAWSLGRIAEHRRDHAAAVRWMNAALGAAPAGGSWPRPFLADAVRILKRGSSWEPVHRVLRAALDAGLDEPWLHREAAMLYEHRLRRFGDALRHAEHAGDEHRAARLRRRLARDEAAAPAGAGEGG